MSVMHMGRRSWMVFAAAAALGCKAEPVPPKVPLGQTAAADTTHPAPSARAEIGPEARAALDSGNALFRKKAYAGALVQYRAASALAPAHAAPLFGLYMVARATRDSAMADSVLAEIRKRNGPMTPAPHTMADTGLRRIHENVGKKPPTG